MKQEIPAFKGTYVLILQSEQKVQVQVGKLGKVEIEPGFYVYIGSAFGPGGLKARVGRHLKKRKKLKWHIDYLRKSLEIIDVYYSAENEQLECIWSAKFAKNNGVALLKGLGSSDCKCPTHFWFFKEKPDINWLAQ